jgi:hypothetical protein
VPNPPSRSERRHETLKTTLSAALLALLAIAMPSRSEAAPARAHGGSFAQQVAAAYGEEQGLPSRDVLALAVDGGGSLWAGTTRGLARLVSEPLEPRDVLAPAVGPRRRPPGRFETIRVAAAGDSGEPAVTALESTGDALLIATARLAQDVRRGGTAGPAPAADVAIWRLAGDGPARRLAGLDSAQPVRALARVAAGQELLIATRDGLLALDVGSAAPSVPSIVLEVDARDVAVAPGGCPVAVAAAEGLFVRECAVRGTQPPWARVLPFDGARSWAPVDARAVAFGSGGALWFASRQGLGRRDAAGRFALLTGEDGLPSSDFAAGAAAAQTTGVWLGTGAGVVHHEPAAAAPATPEGAGRHEALWEYRQGRRWLPADEVRDVVVGPDGSVWIASASGIGRIAAVPMTLAAKARLFEEEIDRYHRRTPLGYVDAVRLAAPGDRSRFEQRSSDNDGLWTGMYGAAECFAFAATRDPRAKERAGAAFRALAFLSEVTQGGSHPAPPGFIARSILPVDGPDPNVGRVEEDRRRRREEDALWKVVVPRWPVDAAGRWYWKTDASSDELDGHFFFYALYHDLVAETDAERAAVRDVVTRIVDHLLAHDYALHDHDGKPTRWAVFGPRQLNHDPLWWGERGLNSLSILSYLRVASHLSGDARYDRAARVLIDEHAYAANVRVPKIHTGPGTGNQSDDEMAFMSFWNLVRYERDPALRAIWAHAFHRYWEMERRERNPFFAFLYAAAVRGLPPHRDAFDTVELELDPTDEALRDAVDTLERYPLDRVDWGLRNSQREDVVPLDDADADAEDDDAPGGKRAPARATPVRGFLRDGKVLPIDERFVDHWNHDPWRLDQGGDGRTLADGASFLLPYYLGLHEGFLRE